MNNRFSQRVRGHVFANAIVALCGLIGSMPLAQATMPGANGAVAYRNSYGTPSAVFTTDEGNVSLPGADVAFDWIGAWSPDGEQIAFTRQFSNTSAIMIIDKDGANPRTLLDSVQFAAIQGLTFTGTQLMEPTWSPDGQRLAFAVREQGRGIEGLWIINVDGTGLMHHTRESRVQQPEWSPDGAEIAFTCDRPAYGTLHQHVCIVNVSIFALRVLSLDGATDHFRPKWSPDGRRIVFNAFGSFGVIGPDTQWIEGYEIWSRKPDGTDLRVHTREESACPGQVSGPTRPRRNYLNPAPSPDGKWIVVQRTDTVVTAVDVGEGRACTYENFVTERSNAGLWLIRADYDDPPGSPAATLLLPHVPFVREAQFPDWQPLPAQLTVQVDDGHGHPLRGLKVELRTPSDRPIADKVPANRLGGSYAFNNVAPGEYLVRATLVDNDFAEGQEPSFDIRHNLEPLEPVWIDRTVKVSDGSRTILHLGFEDRPTLHASSVAPGHRSRLDDMANIYFRTRQFVDWVKANLFSSTSDTVEFYTFAERDSQTGKNVEPDEGYYRQGHSYVVMGTSDSAYENRDGVIDEAYAEDAPENGEWHEFTHHLFFSYISSLPCQEPYKNHLGYRNVSSCDSLDEGFAMFLPTLAARDIDGASDSTYDGFLDLEWQIQAWSYRIGAESGKRFEAEDLAVAALLWDLVDGANAVDILLTQVVAADSTHRVAAFQDQTQMSLRALWDQMVDADSMASVEDLRKSFGQPAVTVDLDGQSPPDVAPVDQVFLMHGFFPIEDDQEIGGLHWSYHYDVDAVSRICQSCPRNGNVGLSNHRGPDVAGNIVEFSPRSNLTPAPGANLGVSAQDASGTPLAGVGVELSVRYPGQALPRSTSRRLLSGAGDPVHLELPTYFNYLLDDGAPLPDCDPDHDVRVDVTVTGTINGYRSADQPSFDNCTYQRAIAAGTDPLVALQVTMTFPEDGAAPVTASDAYASEPPVGNVTLGSWTVELRCSDPVQDDFASGCNRTEYRIDGGPVDSYIDPVIIEGVGSHTIEYRSVDAAGNTEDFQLLVLVIADAPPPSITRFTPTAARIGEPVVVTGEHFGDASDVRFNGTSAAFTVDSATQITAVVPVGTTSGPIAVTTPHGTGTSSANFDVLLPPTITGFSPGSGQVGTAVAITGANLELTTSVAFNGISAGFAVNFPTQVTAIVPVGAATGPIRLTTLGGAVLSTNSFVVTVGPPPSITSFTPTSGIAGTSVTISGANLANVTAVTFNGTNATFRLRKGVLSATVPAAATTGPIGVTTPGGTATSATSFVVPLPPTISGFSPTSGPGGTVVTIDGANFTGASGVTIGGSNVKFTVVSATTITATVGKGTKSGTVSVTTAGGTATGTGSFTVLK